MSAHPNVPVTKSAASAALRARAFTSESDGRTTIHSRAGGIGADWDLAEALRFLEAADEVVWTRSLLQHDLAILSGGRVVCFDVRRCRSEYEFGQLQCIRDGGHAGPHMARLAGDRICFNDEGGRVEGASTEDYA